MAALRWERDDGRQGTLPAVPHMRGRLDALSGTGRHRMLGDNQVLGADNDDAVAGVDTDARADPAGGHGVIALLKTHERFHADGARGAVRDLIRVEPGARRER